MHYLLKLTHAIHSNMCLQLDHVKAEKGSLQEIDFPFIVNLHGSCQDSKCVHLILEYISGYVQFKILVSTKSLYDRKF